MNNGRLTTSVKLLSSSSAGTCLCRQRAATLNSHTRRRPSAFHMSFFIECGIHVAPRRFVIVCGVCLLQFVLASLPTALSNGRQLYTQDASECKRTDTGTSSAAAHKVAYANTRNRSRCDTVLGSLYTPLMQSALLCIMFSLLLFLASRITAHPYPHIKADARAQIGHRSDLVSGSSEPHPAPPADTRCF